MQLEKLNKHKDSVDRKREAIGRITGESDPEAEGEALGADIAGGVADKAAIRQWRSDCRSESCKKGGRW